MQNGLILSLKFYFEQKSELISTIYTFKNILLIKLFSRENNQIQLMSCTGYLLSIKQDIVKIFSFITGDKNDSLSPLVFSN